MSWKRHWSIWNRLLSQIWWVQHFWGSAFVFSWLFNNLFYCASSQWAVHAWTLINTYLLRSHFEMGFEQIKWSEIWLTIMFWPAWVREGAEWCASSWRELNSGSHGCWHPAQKHFGFQWSQSQASVPAALASFSLWRPGLCKDKCEYFCDIAER